MHTKKISRHLSLLFFVLGIFLLLGLIHKVGLDDVVQQLGKLGFKIIFVFLLPISWYFLQSLAWWRILSDDNAKVSLWDIFLVKITGEAVNTITPVSFLGGDPYRIYLLQKKISKTSSASSVVLDRTVYFLAVFFLLLITFFVALFNLPMPKEWRWLFPVFLIGFFIFFILLVMWQKKGMFTSVNNLLMRLGIKKDLLNSYSERLERLDHQISGFYKKHKFHFFEILTLHTLARFLGAIEIFIITSFLGMPVTLIHCLYLASLTVLINTVFVFIPGSMGVMEGGYGALFHLLKINWEYGVSLQLIRRIRAFFWISIGLVIILFYKPSQRRF